MSSWGAVGPSNCKVSLVDHFKVIHNIEGCRVINPTRVNMYMYEISEWGLTLSEVIQT